MDLGDLPLAGIDAGWPGRRPTWPGLSLWARVRFLEVTTSIDGVVGDDPGQLVVEEHLRQQLAP